MKNLFLFLLMGLLAFSCRRPDLTPLDFFTVKTNAAKPRNARNAGIVMLNGQLEKTNGNSVEQCGFVWSTDLVKITSDPAQLPELKAVAPDGDGAFQAEFAGVQPKQSYYFRAFAVLGERRVYAESSSSFSLGEMVAFTENEALLDNNSIRVEGRLIGWEDLQVKALRHGHVYAPEALSKEPRLGLAGCKFSTADTSSAADYDFWTQLDSLSFNTNYNIRAYAITESDTFYSSKTKTVAVRDGWLRMADMPAAHADGVAAVAQNKIYMGLGAGVLGGNFQSSLTRRYFQFDPAATAPWALRAELGSPIVKPQPMANSVSFAIKDSVFVLFGGYIYFQGANTIFSNVVDFWKYLPLKNQWDIPEVPPDSMKARFNAVAFVIGDKAYVGSGTYFNANTAQIEELNDFWEYNSANGRWRRVAPMPARLPNGTLRNDFGRSDAISFVLNGLAYVGGGVNLTLGLTDFWTFIPPQNDKDLGTWVETGKLPGRPRWQAVSFAVEGRGYYGIGYYLPQSGNEYGYYMNDFWAFDPQKGWSGRTPFKGGRRSRAFGIGLGNRGYVGGGEQNIADSTQTVILESIRSDFWQYVPR